MTNVVSSGFGWKEGYVVSGSGGQRKRRWRAYETASRSRPVEDFIDALSDEDAAAVLAAMKDVQIRGLIVARHLRGDIYEVRASGNRQIFRVLFAPEGRYGQILLSPEGFSKKTQKTPPQEIALAEQRLADWRSRGPAERGR